ncbi:uncharacterized protein LOC121770403 [Salvia splendens]|uniref:uncharacterized protein LOC121770403 n=1 Tax=Salvia splendens TaxID=180675 RepID=UPI001C25AE18|nr:uncharacterized protein LOC121770403 [Salvia splendens]
MNLMVDLTDVPDRTDSPVDARDAQRQARRRLRDDIEEHVPQTEEGSLGLETAAPEQVPYAAESGSPDGSSDSEKEQQEELNFEPTEIWITKELLDKMRKFTDPKRTAIYKEKSAVEKYAKFRKMYDSAELKEISSNDEFQSYIDAIGFDWLLKHSTSEVPIDLAREFFSTFRFKSTTDLDAESINFRLFNEEHGKEVCFYEVGKSDVQVEQEAASVEAGSWIEVEEMRTEVGWMRSEIKMVREEIVALRGKGNDNVEIERVRKEVAGMRTEVDEMKREIGMSREEVLALKGRITDLVAASSRHADRMGEAISLMMTMMKWLREKFPDAPKSLPAPSGGSMALGPGNLSIQKPPQATKPLTTPSSTRPVTLKKTVPRQTEEMTEEPESPARKKAKGESVDSHGENSSDSIRPLSWAASPQLGNSTVELTEQASVTAEPISSTVEPPQPATPQLSPPPVISKVIPETSSNSTIVIPNDSGEKENAAVDCDTGGTYFHQEALVGYRLSATALR